MLHICAPITPMYTCECLYIHTENSRDLTCEECVCHSYHCQSGLQWTEHGELYVPLSLWPRGSFHCVAPLGLPHPAVQKKGEWRTGHKSSFARSGSGGISSALILLQILQNSKILDADDSDLCAPKEKKVTDYTIIKPIK